MDPSLLISSTVADLPEYTRGVRPPGFSPIAQTSNCQNCDRRLNFERDVQPPLSYINRYEGSRAYMAKVLKRHAETRSYFGCDTCDTTFCYEHGYENCLICVCAHGQPLNPISGPFACNDCNRGEHTRSSGQPSQDPGSPSGPRTILATGTSTIGNYEKKSMSVQSCPKCVFPLFLYYENYPFKKRKIGPGYSGDEAVSADLVNYAMQIKKRPRWRHPWFEGATYYGLRGFKRDGGCDYTISNFDPESRVVMNDLWAKKALQWTGLLLAAAFIWWVLANQSW